MALAGVLLSSTSLAATFVVNDAGDAPLAGAMCTSSPNPCTLRAAIQAVNANADHDFIHFDFSGNQVTISPASALPPIVTPVTIDGYALGAGHPNTLAVGNNASISIRLDGQNAGASTPGLLFSAGASQSVLRGIAVTRFGAGGVILDGQHIADGLVDVLVSGNFIGTDGSDVADDANGLLANANGGILILDEARGTQVGGDLPALRNLIVGLANQGGVVLSHAQATEIRNNYIGTNRAGDSRRATGTAISIHSSNDSVVRANTLGAHVHGVVVSGNVGSTNHSFVQGNRIGVGTIDPAR